MSMITRLMAPKAYQLDAPPARLVMPETTAASRSALALSLMDDMAMSRPSEETAIASMTPAVPDVNESSSQLNFFASALSSIVAARMGACSYGYVIIDLPAAPRAWRGRFRTQNQPGCRGPRRLRTAPPEARCADRP